LKVKVLYYELKEREFRSYKTLNKFLKKKLPDEILRAIETKEGIQYMLELGQFLYEYRDKDYE
jgi:hypothetical protein